MSRIPTPRELTIWGEGIIADVVFMRKVFYHTDGKENAMDWSEICAVLRYRTQSIAF